MAIAVVVVWGLTYILTKVLIQQGLHPHEIFFYRFLVAYAGIDAAVNQSGNFEGTEVHMSKRGSPYLRRALYTAAGVAAFHDPELSG